MKATVDHQMTILLPRMYVICRKLKYKPPLTHPFAPKECLAAESTRLLMGFSKRVADSSNAATEKIFPAISIDGRAMV